MRKALLITIMLGLIAGAGCVSDQPTQTSSVRWPGRQPDGSVLLPNQWSLRPVGTQVELGDCPVNLAVHPSAPYAAVLHSGYSRHEIIIVDLARQAVASRTPLHEAFYGLQFSPDGKQLYCSGAGDEVIHAFAFADGNLSNHREIRLRDSRESGVPTGIAIGQKSHHLFAANLWAQTVSDVNLDDDSKIAEIPLTAKPAAVVQPGAAASADFDTAAATKRKKADLFQLNPDDPLPYTCLLDEKRDRMFVSLWAQSSIAVIELSSRQIRDRWSTQEHPCEMALTKSGKFLFVANANRNTVTVIDANSGRVIENIWTALYPQAPAGSTPNSIALTPDDQMLFVANANNNTVAVFDVGTPGATRSLGFIPVGWYPNSVRVTPDGKTLLVANRKGLTSLPDPHGPQPGVRPDSKAERQYSGSLFHGTLSLISLKDIRQHMPDYTGLAYHCSPLNETATVPVPAPKNNPVPDRPGDQSPIKYCIYVIKENRTYDQVFGDMPKGNGDPTLCLFPRSATPNHHKLADEFVLLDNFYAEAEVSAQGHEWSMGAYSSDFVEKLWPFNYGHNASGKFPYPAEGKFPVAYPSAGYLWDQAQAAGVSYRSYGEFVNNADATNQPGSTNLKALKGHFDEWYHGFDLGYPDTARAGRFITDLKQFEQAGEMPRLQIVRLGNDHTHGATAGRPTPMTYLADNDLALGRVVDAISHSKFWPQTAIFVVEDDSQNGPDHVDAHRTVALAISPYTRRGSVDSTMYSTCSMLRTMELILGMKPMSQFDAAACPMFNSFQPTPDLTPYVAEDVKVDWSATNGVTAWGAQMEHLYFASEDAVDDALLSEMVWHSVRGNTSAMPAPTRAAFVFTPTHRDDD